VRTSFKRALGAAVAAATFAAAAVSIMVPTAQAQGSSLVTAVRAAHHPGFDRVVFEFEGAVPARHVAGYVSSVVADPSGKPVAVSGRYFVELHLSPATAWNGKTVVTPQRLEATLPNVREVVRVGDFEGVLSYALGLQERVPVKIFTLTAPSRVVVDIPVPAWPVLKVGSKASDVLAAQYMLTARGHSVTADGAYTTATASAVRAFQHAKGLVVDGVVGQGTWRALVWTVSQGSSGNMVRALQVELVRNGLRVQVDGIFGPQTRAAVERLQARSWQVVDGLVGPQTWMALICHLAA